MIAIVHGDNELQIRHTIQKVKESNKTGEIITLTKPDALTLRQHLGSASMFFDERLTIVEGMLKKGVSEDVVAFLASLPKETKCYFVEYIRLDKVTKAGKTVLGGKKLLDELKKRVGGIQIIACNDYTIFDFLDAVKPGNAKQALSLYEKLISLGYTGEELFYMLCDHMHFLLIAKDVGTKGLAGMHEFRANKMLTQAKQFTQKQLKTTYEILFQLEIAQKEKRIGEGSPFSMEDDMRFLLAQALR